jgi:hypothetical protein
MNGQLPLPLSPEDFMVMRFDRRYLKVERAGDPIAWFGPWPLRISWDWYREDRGRCRYSEWWDPLSPHGICILADYGVPGQEAVVTYTTTRDKCRAYLTERILNQRSILGFPDNGLTVDDWE